MSPRRSPCRSSVVNEVVVKVGGGLLRAEGLEGLRRACADVLALARDRPVLVVPGGGPFADAVRALDARIGLGDDVAHRLALHAMDQLGVLLAPMLPGAELLRKLIAPRALGLLHAAPAFAGLSDVPESWDVTSDSLAVLAAGAIGAEEAILLKPVDGAAVDPYLPEAIRRTGVRVVVRSPGPGSTAGTRIARG
jgi:5-(aminomethyl)-3-furanmethanol phosphate kinase